jgi:putative AdoMet-dependent methyltransferase
MGREFVDLFDSWADSYDQSVSGHDAEYKDVFENYDLILDKVSKSTAGTVLEFGVGTGNLTKKLLQNGHNVIGVEPSAEMRKRTKEKFPELTLIDGDFLHFPQGTEQIDTIVSTYAFHHLTDEEKAQAIYKYSHLLNENGKIVFADTVFESEKQRNLQLKNVEKQGHYNLLQDLQTEYYTTIGMLDEMFTNNGFSVTFERLNLYVWLIKAEKRK